MELKAPKGAVRKRKIVGRGQSSGWGETAGRGVKGQKARSGGGIRIGFEGGQMPLFRRLPRRGFSNHPFKTVRVPVSLAMIDKKYENGETVNTETLIAKGLLKKSERDDYKVLGTSEEFKKKLTVDVAVISKGAHAQIEKAGGSILTAAK